MTLLEAFRAEVNSCCNTQTPSFIVLRVSKVLLLAVFRAEVDSCYIQSTSHSACKQQPFNAAFIWNLQGEISKYLPCH